MTARGDQGLSPSITDPKTLDEVAGLLRRNDRKADSTAA
jgi:hypothetical protein